MIPNIFGLGAPTLPEIQHAADTLIKAAPLSPETVRDYFLVLPSTSWKDAGLALIDRGAPPQVVAAGLQLAQAKVKIPWSAISGAVTIGSAALSAFHGYRRNQSVGWAIWWFAMGMVFPVVTPVIGVAQGFGRPKK